MHTDILAEPWPSGTSTCAATPCRVRPTRCATPWPAAEVGDDVFGDDPTVNALEERAAELLGKEAGLFVASGTMGNVVAQLAHLQRGQETIAGREHHMTVDEASGHAVIVGTSIRALDDRADGTLALEDIEAAFRNPLDPHEPITGMITLENTHAHCGAQPLPPGYVRAVGELARRRGVAFHIDGARFWNAVVAQAPDGITARDLAGPADTVTFCLSKGLGCPVGSMVVGHEGRHLAGAPRRASCSAAACARPASSPRPGSSPSRTARPG